MSREVFTAYSTGNEREKTIEICETEEDRGTKMAKKSRGHNNWVE